MFKYLGRLAAIASISLAACLGTIPALAEEPLTEDELLEFARIYKRLTPREREAVAKSIRPALKKVRALPPDLPSPRERINKLTTTVLIRDSFVPIAYITPPTTPNESLPENGASFSFTRDFNAGISTFAGTGAVMVAVHGDRWDPLFNGSEPSPTLTYVNYAGGIEFDAKIKNGKTSGFISALAGSEFEISVDDSWIRKHYLRTNAVFTTDYDQSARIFGLETMWQPWAPPFVGTSIRSACP